MLSTSDGLSRLSMVAAYGKLEVVKMLVELERRKSAVDCYFSLTDPASPGDLTHWEIGSSTIPHPGSIRRTHIQALACTHTCTHNFAHTHMHIHARAHAHSDMRICKQKHTLLHTFAQQTHESCFGRYECLFEGRSKWVGIMSWNPALQSDWFY